jgi:gliding motility-associated lipoprotein GldH
MATAMNLKRSIWLLSALALCSCDKTRVFDTYKSVGGNWNKDSIVSFELPEMDTAQSYNLLVNLRGDSDYPFNNIFLIVSMDQPDGLTKVDTLEYQMADPDGKMLGNGFSDIKESALFFKDHYKFKKGKYTVHIRQAVRESGKIEGVRELKGITDVGFRVERAK